MSLPLSRETQNRGALEEIVHKGGRERRRGKQHTHTQTAGRKDCAEKGEKHKDLNMCA